MQGFCLLALFSLLLEPLMASARRNERRAPAQVYRKCLVPNTVALTFDDGPYYNLADAVGILNDNGIKGTFFFNGNNWACIYNPELVEAIKFAHASGHQLASHSWSHKRMTDLSWDQMHDELWRVEQALSRIVGVTPAFMRPPFGEYNDMLLEVASLRGQSIVIWDFDSEDGRHASLERQRWLYDDAASRRPDTILSLQHEVHDSSIFETLPYAIQRLRAAGYNFVTVAECLGYRAPYSRTLPPATRTAEWAC